MMINTEIIISAQEVEELVKKHLKEEHGIECGNSIYAKRDRFNDFDGFKVVPKEVEKPLIEEKERKEI